MIDEPRDDSSSGWLTSLPALQPEWVGRLMYASLCNLQGAVFDELMRIRDHAMKRNLADGLHVALLYQSGWFVEWIEGPEQGIKALMQRVVRDTRHRGLKVVHTSEGPRRLLEPWSSAIVTAHEAPTDFARRVVAMRDARLTSAAIEPAAVWRRLSTPLLNPGAEEQDRDDRFQRLMVVSARGTESFDLVRWLGQSARVEVVHRRFAGSRPDALDVGCDYVDLPAGEGWRRVIAMARNGLQLGLTHAFLPDYAVVVLLLDAVPQRNIQLLDKLLRACQRVQHLPALVAVGPAGWHLPEMAARAQASGMVWLEVRLDEAHGGGPHVQWEALRPLLDRIRRLAQTDPSSQAQTGLG